MIIYFKKENLQKISKNERYHSNISIRFIKFVETSRNICIIFTKLICIYLYLVKNFLYREAKHV